MSKSCKLPNCYPVSFDAADSVVSLDNFQDTQLEVIIYSVDSDNEELEPISLGVGVYDLESLNALGISTDGIYRIDFPTSGNLKVSLFTEDSFKGTTTVLLKSTSDLKALVSDTSSIVIEDTTASPKATPFVMRTPRVAAPKATGTQLPPAVFNQMAPSAQGAAPSAKGASPTLVSPSKSEKSIVGSMMDIIDQSFPTRFIGGVANSTLIFIILLIFILTGLLR